MLDTKWLSLLVGTTALLAVPAVAQQINGTPGSPTTTTTIEGNVLPPPPQRFEGSISLNALQSKPAWPARVTPPRGAPNVLLIMTDDTGFGAASTFGGVIPTPNVDRIAQEGLRYTNFHSTALCSPTRAALLTGRNHAGPFDQWPNGLGFDYFYGFVGGDASQWEPNLFRNTSPIAPYVGKPG